MTTVHLPHITIALDDVTYRALRADLDHIQGAREKALRSAVYRTAEWVRTHVARGLSKELGVKQSDLTRKTRYGRVTVYKRSDSAMVLVTGNRIPVYRFGARPKEPRHKNPPRGGVSWKIGVRPRNRERSAFVAMTKSGHVSVWKRDGRKSLPITQLFGPSIPQVAITQPDINRIYRVDASGQLVKNIASQVDRFLKGQAVDRE